MVTDGSHTKLAKTFHWGFIFLYAYGLLKQLNDVSQLEDAGLLVLEVAFVSLFLLIVLMRYFYMRRFETFLGAREPVSLFHKRLAKAIHRSIYLCLALLPLSGLMIAGLFALEIRQGPLQDFSLALHEFCASLSYFLISIHIAAAIFSRFRREGIWTSMVPFWKEKL
jgi:cytochrome b561